MNKRHRTITRRGFIGAVPALGATLAWTNGTEMMAGGGRAILSKLEAAAFGCDDTPPVHFIASLHARRLATKIALAAIALRYGGEFALTSQFDELRAARTAGTPEDLPVRFFANEGLMRAYIHAAYQHSVMCYLSAGMRKGWALITLFGGLCYLVALTSEYTERESRQFSIFYDATTKKCFTPVVLADEMTLIGHVLSPATKFEDPTAVHEQWSPLLTEYCAEKGVIVEPIAAN
jgi:hypothetical protein